MSANDPWPEVHYPGSVLEGAHPGLASDCPDARCVQQRATTSTDLRQRIADLLVNRCPAHGCVEPEWSECHCELADPLLALFAGERAAGRVDGLAEAAAAIQAVIDRDRAKFPARSNDRAALGGAREIVLGLLNTAPDGEGS